MLRAIWCVCSKPRTPPMTSRPIAVCRRGFVSGAARRSKRTISWRSLRGSIGPIRRRGRASAWKPDSIGILNITVPCQWLPLASRIGHNRSVLASRRKMAGRLPLSLATVNQPKVSHMRFALAALLLVVPCSIRVEGKATGKLEIGSVDTSRKLLQRAESQAADAMRKSLEDQIEQLNDQKAGFDAQAEAAKTQQTLIGNL